jgi:hypothetical protein
VPLAQAAAAVGAGKPLGAHHQTFICGDGRTDGRRRLGGGGGGG